MIATAGNRRSPRARWEAPCSLEIGGGKLPATTLDLSVGGLCVETDLGQRIGDRLDVEIMIPGASAPSRLRVRVAWARQQQDGAILLGLAVESAHASTLRRVEEFVFGSGYL